MSILKEVIDWAVEQDDWKQDAIRRILENVDCTEKDVEEVANIIKHNHGYLDEIDVPPVKIDRGSIKTVEGSTKHKVIIQKIENPKNVNALSGIAKLQFALDGLTVVYGENGTGKSGYNRILKKVCKSRAVEDVYPDVFSSSGIKPISATISYSVNGEDKSLGWIENKYLGGPLEELVVYDSKCGKIQVTDKNELIYLPNGTDIFKKLVELIGEVKQKLAELCPKETTLDLEGIDSSTQIFEILSNLTKESDIDSLLLKLTWTSEKESELFSISKSLIDSNEVEVQQKLTRIEKEKANIKSIQEGFRILQGLLASESADRCAELINSKAILHKALHELSEKMEGEGALPGTGNELWRIMYDAAKEFSIKSAYPDTTYPNLEGSCVLCQQRLDSLAKERFNSFEVFVKGEVKGKFDQVLLDINLALKSLGGMTSQIESVQSLLKGNFSRLKDDAVTDLIKRLDDIKAAQKNRIKYLKDEISPETHGILDLVSGEELQELGAAISLLEDDKKETSELINKESIEELKRKKYELEAQKVACSRATQISSYIEYLKSKDKYDLMLRCLDHAPISRKGNSIITNALKESFLKEISSELTKLGGEKIPLFVDSTTSDGSPTFKLSLRGADLPRKCNLDSILSEGEQKIASLAGLLAELKTAGHSNGIILDDPVSSLDHQYRARIAKRLVEEAKQRQIVIFTHDIAFLFDLEHYAKELNVPTHLQNIRKEGTKPGIIFNDNPWHAQNVKARLNTLKEDLTKLKSAQLDGEAYNGRAGSIYGRIRETWERVTEEILFNEVVMRFGQSIQTQRLNKVNVEDQDFVEIYFEMNKCSKWMVGHDKSLSLSDARPKEEEIALDIDKVDKFIKRIRKSQELICSERKKKVEKLPVAEVIG